MTLRIISKRRWNGAWRLTPVIAALKRLRQEDCPEFEAISIYRVKTLIQKGERVEERKGEKNEGKEEIGSI